MKILVVEDEIRSREGLVGLLYRLHYTYEPIFTADNGQEGLDIVHKYMPEIIITDIKMPIMDGLEMIRRMRNEKIMSKVIVLSAFADFSYAQKAISFGVDEYILKPISVGPLIEVLEKVTGKHLTEIQQKNDKKTYSKLIQSVYKLLAEPLGLSLSLNEVALQLKVTPEYLGTQFYKETEIHFSVYLKSKRLEYAKCLLRNTDTKISNIAEKVGYIDIKYFSKLFKKEVGCLPLEYRRKI